MKVKTLRKTMSEKSLASSRIKAKNAALLALRGIWKNKSLVWRKDLNKGWAAWSRSY